MLCLEAVRLAQGDFTLSADFVVPEGSVAAVIGPSGGGKSTLLAGVAGFLSPVAGRIVIGGEDMTEAAPHARPIAMLFQDNNLFAHLNVAQNVGLGIAPSLKMGAEAKARVSAVLEQVGLGGLDERLPSALSGGQQSRAALARVLVSERALVLLDEPFSALGPGLREEMLDLAVRALAEADRTMLMVTHDPNDALRVADHVVFVDGGVAQAPVATKALFADPPAALAAYLGR